MVRYLENKEIERKHWNECIAEARFETAYAYDWYLDIVCPGWSALVMNDYGAVLPLTRGNKLGVDYLFQPLFAQQLGIFTPGPVSPEMTRYFLDAIPSGFKWVDVCFHGGVPVVPMPDAAWHARPNYVLDMNMDYERISADYATNTRRNIARAGAHGLIVHRGDYSREMLNLKKRFAYTKFPARVYERMELLIRKSLEKKRGEVWMVTGPDQDPLAATLLLRSRTRLIYLLSASSGKGRELRAMFLLLDRILREFSGSALLLDFEGSEIPGLARFYGGYGAARQTYHRLVINHLPWWIRRFKKIK